jgi:hypothetical protein
MFPFFYSFNMGFISMPLYYIQEYIEDAFDQKGFDGLP